MPSYYELIKQSKLAGGSGGGPQPILVPKLAIENGTYFPVDDEADGYSSVTVNVPDVNDVAFVPPQKFKSDGSALADYKIYGSNGVKTENKTAVLPLTFTAKAGNAIDWTIEGNDELGENMVPLVTEANGWRTGYRDKVHGHYGSGQYIGEFLSQSVSVDNNTTVTIKAGGMNPEYASYESGTVYFFDDSNTYIGYADFNNYSGSAISVPLSATTLDFAIRTGYTGFPAVESSDFWVMLVKGSTAPDHYIPYQKGVGERTANLFDKTAAGATANVYPSGSAVYAGSATTSVVLPCLPNTTYTICKQLGERFTAYWTKSYPLAQTACYGSISNNLATSITITTGEDAQYVCAFVHQEGTDTASLADMLASIMIIKGSTASETFIPYGYKVPLTVSQQGQPDKTVDIYIGDSPLTEGETVSKTSTGVDIELFDGENVISTTLYNKPETAITYTISTGVGEEVSGSYRIPVTINSTTTNVPIGDTPLIEDEYVSYAEQKIYKYVDSVLTPVDPPSALPQISTANGENKLSIETEIQPDLVDVALLTPIELIPVALGTKTISVNDTYDASDDSLDGYSSVVVNVPSPPAPVLISKSIAENGTYTAASDEADGYSEVTVNIRSYSEVLDQGLQATLQEEE